MACAGPHSRIQTRNGSVLVVVVALALAAVLILLLLLAGAGGADQKVPEGQAAEEGGQRRWRRVCALQNEPSKVVRRDNERNGRRREREREREMKDEYILRVFL